jgi:para-aminobenzoate synthetase component I
VSVLGTKHRLPLVEELRPTPDPWAVALRFADWPRLLFLDSTLKHPTLGRFSYVTADPLCWLYARGERVSVFPPDPEADDPLAVLDDWLERYRTDTLPGLPPFQGGVAGLFGYDLCHRLERLPRPRFDEFQVPDLVVGLYDWVIAFDHRQDRAWIISTGIGGVPAGKRLHGLRRKALSRKPPVTEYHFGNRLPLELLCQQYPHPAAAELYSNFDRPGYLRAVRRAIDYIEAGDCFQVNLSQRLLAPARHKPLQLYQRLRELNPAPFGGYFDLGGCHVLSASPERFLRVTDGWVETRPIKGTRPRGRTPAEDEAAAAELLHSAKDRAENVMIVDLLRNDLGRVCRYGTVRVPQVCRLETYPYVHHLVSQVRGQLREDRTAVDLMRAAFPGGSVTGAPKVRAMEIIAELEPTARGPYCGSLAFLGLDGSLDSNLLIRTFTQGRGWLQFPVGGGVVADSTPEGEYEETLHKAAGMLRALQED